MKKALSIITAAAMSLGICVSLTACGNSTPEAPVNGIGNSFQVASPDGSLVTKVDVDALGQATYKVEKNGLAVVNTSALGFDIEEDDFSLLTLEKEATRRVVGEYENKTGKHSKVEYDCNELVLTFKGLKFYLDVTFRNYDDGYAYKYDVRSVDGKSGIMTVNEEKSELALPASRLWYMPYVSESSDINQFSYESNYSRINYTNLSDTYVSMPMMYRVTGSDVYSLVSESNLIGSGYYGSFWQEQEENRGKGILQTVHTPGSYNPDEDNKISYPFTSPWRLGVTGDLKTVEESDLVEKLYDDVEYWKPDNYDELTPEEQAVYNYDWVEPGVASWSWLVHHSNGENQKNYNMHKEYVSLASDMGWTYYLLDAEWEDGLDPKVWEEFVEYAHSNGVKIMVWAGSFLNTGNGKPNVIEEKFAKWKSMGIDGLKIDFFDGQGAHNLDNYGEDSATIKMYETIYQAAARNQLLVNCHGCNKPTGERRIYPNVINREAIQGNEFVGVDSSTTVNQLFIRNVVGPSDFTPVVNPLSSGLTMGQQLALAVLFESGTPSMADYTDAYYEETIMDLYKSIPSARETTVFLCGELDGYYVAAVKFGEDWFVAGACSIVDKTATFKLDFLDDGNYTATIYQDDGWGGVERTSETVTKTASKTMSMISNGGFVIRLTKTI